MENSENHGILFHRLLRFSFVKKKHGIQITVHRGSITSPLETFILPWELHTRGPLIAT